MLELKVASRVVTAVFTLNVMFFKIAPKLLNIWATFVKKSQRTFKSSTIWLHKTCYS